MQVQFKTVQASCFSINLISMPAAPVRLHQLLPFLTCSVCRRQRCQPRDPAAAGRCADDTSGLPAPGESCHPEQRAKGVTQGQARGSCIIYPQQSPTQDPFVSAISKVKCNLELKRAETQCQN